MVEKTLLLVFVHVSKDGYLGESSQYSNNGCLLNPKMMTKMVTKQDPKWDSNEFHIAQIGAQHWEPSRPQSRSYLKMDLPWAEQGPHMLDTQAFIKKQFRNFAA